MIEARDIAKPCPFCGGSDLATPPGIAIVVCGDCSAAGPPGVPHPTSGALTDIAAHNKWNTRVSSETIALGQSDMSEKSIKM
tara:strand:+ start:805 stop:1050 length:246 start_codon:yes stop_codon:yes gene_type:complete